VTIAPGTAAGPIESDDIVLKSDHPNVSEMKIPVNILISKSGAD
jgi:hypothetical protein